MNDKKQPVDPDESAVEEVDEDTQAILSRRQFLVKNALLGAGVMVGVTACKPDPNNLVAESPRPCLKVMPRKTDVVQPRDVVQPKPAPCLKVAPQRQKPDVEKPQPQVCLKVAPVEQQDNGDKTKKTR